MKYIVFDRNANPLACILFGSPAWKVAPRDSFIGWDILSRKQYLHLIANNLRFVIVPWVRVPHLASHVLDSLLAASGTIGHINTDIPFTCSKPLSNGNAFKAPVTRLPIGSSSAKQKDGLETTDTIPFVYPSRTSISIPLS